MQQTGRKVAVTGANGFIASHIIKKLLEKGYNVIGTLRDPTDEKKTAHLKNLNNSNNLQLLQASLDQEENSFIKAFENCECVFHVASPVFFKGTEQQIVQPALQGTQKVLDAVYQNKNTIKNLVYTSSMAAVKTGVFQDYPVNENSWADEEFMRNSQNWYALSKTKAEQLVHEFCNTNDWINFASVCPTVVQGPAISKTIQNFTLQTCISDIIKGDNYSVGEFMFYNIVDVRDVADLHINAFEQNVNNGRYLAIGDTYDIELYGNTLKKLCQELNISEKIILKKPTPETFKRFQYSFDNSQSFPILGQQYIKLEQCLKDSLLSIKDVYI